MVITELLSRNAALYGDEVCLVCVNPEVKEKREVTWREYELMETNAHEYSRREITWRLFDEGANRFANLLLSRGIGRGDKVAILLMNCLEWLPIYFGILKTGAVAVPMNYRYTAEEIEYCLKLSETRALVFGPEFVGRVEAVIDRMPGLDPRFFVGADCPTFAESYSEVTPGCSAEPPAIEISEQEDGALYFSSGTTGFPKAILHDHRSLMSAAEVEQNHHGQDRDDNFLCIAPLYHTGGKMHWFGSLLAGSKGVLLRGTKPEWILQTISDEKVTIVWLLVPWVQDILQAIDQGDVKPDALRTRPVAAHAHRRPAGAAEPCSPLAGALPQPPVRHRLRAHRIGRSWVCPPGHRERPQGRSHRHPGLPVADDDRRRLRGAGRAGCHRRAGRQGPGGHEELLQRSRGDGDRA